MRLSLAAASLAVSVALLAGCSSSTQGTSALPGSGVGQQMGQHGGGFRYAPPGHKISSAEVLKLEMSGKLPAPITRDALKWQLHQIQNGARPNFHVHPDTGIAAWGTATNYSYLLGMSKKLKTSMAINTATNGCYDPVTAKVDHSKNVWVGCLFNSAFTNGAAQEYSSTGSLVNTYNAACASNYGPSGCLYTYSEAFDSAEAGSNVILGLVYFEPCSSTACDYASGFEIFNGAPSSVPTFINVYDNGTGGVNIEDIGYFDADGNNIYFTYYGCQTVSPYTCGYGLAEIAGYSSPSATYTVLLAAGSIGFWAGTNVGHGSAWVGTGDQIARTYTQYALPWTGSPMATLGPTATNVEGFGDPVSGGFSKGDKNMVIGDAYGWFDTIKVSTNTNNLVGTPDCPSGCEGAGYSPSDK